MRVFLAALPLLLLLCGCFSPHKTSLQRTAIDQQLSAGALRSCVEKLDLDEVARGRRYALTVSAPTDADADLARALLQGRLLDEGIDVQRAVDRGEWVLELVVHFSGTDVESSLWGVPLFVPGLPAGSADVSLFKSTTQTGRARLGVLVWGPSGQLVSQLPVVQDSRYYTNFSFLTFFGDFRSTDLEEFVEPGNEED